MTGIPGVARPFTARGAGCQAAKAFRRAIHAPIERKWGQCDGQGDAQIRGLLDLSAKLAAQPRFEGADSDEKLLRPVPHDPMPSLGEIDHP